MQSALKSEISNLDLQEQRKQKEKKINFVAWVYCRSLQYGQNNITILQKNRFLAYHWITISSVEKINIWPLYCQLRS